MLSATQYRELVSGRWQGAWPAALRGLLAVVEPAYSRVIGAKNRRFDSGHWRPIQMPAPVVSVGNLTVGGTGKTPLVCWLAEWFRGHGAAVTLISRGYGALSGKPNDEALELAARLPVVPHLQRADRVAAAHEALAPNPRQVLILDDAFQHRWIARDLDIVLLDALEPFGYERLLPRGLLREPIEGLARAHVVALSRADAVNAATRETIRARVQQVALQAAWIELEHRPLGLVNTTGRRAPIDSLRGQSVVAFCGLGNPDGFRHTLAACEMRVTAFRALADHYAYRPEQRAQLEEWVSSLDKTAAVVCTRKDLVKIPSDSLGGRELWALEIGLHVASGQGCLEELLEPLAARAGCA